MPSPAPAADVRLLDEPLDPIAELARFSAAHRQAGAIVSFTGQVRGGGNQGDDGGEGGGGEGGGGEGGGGGGGGGTPVEALELRHYPPLTLAGIEALAGEALSRWPLAGLLIAHRVGTMRAGEAIVLVAAASRHRRDAFAAADFAMDHLKSASWFWKRERTDGGWRWIEPRAEDHADKARWG